MGTGCLDFLTREVECRTCDDRKYVAMRVARCRWGAIVLVDAIVDFLVDWSGKNVFICLILRRV